MSFTTADPADSATRVATATATVEHLDASLTARFAPLKDCPVVFHDAYGYLADRYGLQVFGSIALGDATAQGSVHCVSPEAQQDPALAEQLAKGSVAKLGPALGPNGSSLESAPGLYAQLLTGLADAMVGCSNP